MLRIKPLGERQHDLELSVVKGLESIPADAVTAELRATAVRIVAAKAKKNAIILIMGAHVLRSGVQKYLIDLMRRGYISCLAMNGAGIIHDYEFARIGQTTENVARYIKTGEFGLWKETGEINDVINRAYKDNPVCGMGEAVGREIAEGRGFPHSDISVFAAAYRLKIPATVHVGIGYDIIHEHPNCEGAATGALSYNDFLHFARAVQSLEGGVVMNFGSAIMGPEVYLKALSMARNVAHQNGQEIRRFAVLVCDLYDLPKDFRKEAPKDSPAYYFRPWKTMLVRTVADGGESFYVQGPHAETVPQLWAAVNEEEKRLSP